MNTNILYPGYTEQLNAYLCEQISKAEVYVENKSPKIIKYLSREAYLFSRLSVDIFLTNISLIEKVGLTAINLVGAAVGNSNCKKNFNDIILSGIISGVILYKFPIPCNILRLGTFAISTIVIINTSLGLYATFFMNHRKELKTNMPFYKLNKRIYIEILNTFDPTRAITNDKERYYKIAAIHKHGIEKIQQLTPYMKTRYNCSFKNICDASSDTVSVLAAELQLQEEKTGTVWQKYFPVKS